MVLSSFAHHHMSVGDHDIMLLTASIRKTFTTLMFASTFDTIWLNNGMLQGLWYMSLCSRVCRWF